ncbi:OLC1v1025863C1 [Oldenlandia corymbosa var. corymbosa]|uniref:OLC1v1025863C1 n=1 Tax=Oldenlandia corymbosa var. corymbosa TaxID=529605 RepID=A0AAV1C744_OLDCO|nr:OLC1v1025863C1 [Oldenlandia corymbosa var. corymbosa]
MKKENELVTPGEAIGRTTECKAGRGAYTSPENSTVYASLTGFLSVTPATIDSTDQRPIVEVTGHKAHGPVPEPGSLVIARVTKVMAKLASVDIMCVGPKSVKEKFTGTIRQQDVRATEIDKVDMHASFRPGDIVRAVVLSLGDARAYYLSTAKNELGVVSAESAAGEIMVAISWTEMQCPLTGQIEQRKASYGLDNRPPAMTAAFLSHLPLLQPPSNLSSPPPNRHFFRNSHCIPSLFLPRPPCFGTKLRIRKPFALTESDSPKSLDPDPKTLLQELADSFVLPADYFSKLPRDLRLDLNDAAFDLSNGPVKDECGQELGEVLLNISRAWEQADASTSASLVRKLPVIVETLSDNYKSAMGKRLISAGRRFQSMGSYGGGEPAKIAKVMIRAGKFLSATAVAKSTTDEEPKVEARMFKFGELQVEFTPDKAYIGAGIGAVFGIFSLALGQGLQSIPESSLQYANDNALLLAKSLRGTLLVLFYSSTFLSGFASIGLVLLGFQLSSKDK